jgi:hypothetical protein
MGKVILEKKDSVTIDLGKFEIALLCEAWSESIEAEYNCEEPDNQAILLLILAIDPFLKWATPETRKYVNEIKSFIMEEIKEENNVVPINEEEPFKEEEPANEAN